MYFYSPNLELNCSKKYSKSQCEVHMEFFIFIFIFFKAWIIQMNLLSALHKKTNNSISAEPPHSNSASILIVYIDAFYLISCALRLKRCVGQSHGSRSMRLDTSTVVVQCEHWKTEEKDWISDWTCRFARPAGHTQCFTVRLLGFSSLRNHPQAFTDNGDRRGKYPLGRQLCWWKCTAEVRGQSPEWKSCLQTTERKTKTQIRAGSN